MPTDVQLQQSSAEALTYPLDYSPQLPEGVELLDVDVTHTPPADGVELVIETSVVEGLGYVTVPQGLEVGVHLLSCIADTGNATVAPEILLIITVIR